MRRFFRPRVVRAALAVAVAMLPCAALVPVASAHSVAPPVNPVAQRLDAYWNPARLTAALPVDTGLDKDSVYSTAPDTGAAASSAVDGPMPGEFIPPSHSFDGIPQTGTFFWTDTSGTGRTCSGSVVRSPGHDLVLSAGHCLRGYSGASPRRNLAFVPQYHDGLKPFGVFPVRVNGVYVPQQYYDLKEHAGAQYDYGFAVTEPNQDGKLVQDAAGAVQLLTDTGYHHAPVRLIGYPGGADKPLECWSRTTRYDSDDPDEPGSYPRIACDAFVDGTSGGPMLVPWKGGWAVVGVIGGFHTGGYTPQISYSAYFGKSVGQLYGDAVTGAPPAGPSS
ncbi:trypsin-like peptidase domain-containing protein [Streptomyces longisporus]|uniref:trypsin-like serine peptidase n=1 Tax=Streptomyces longisporus TaxID=1948 RepID=UPI0031E2EF0B